jgi:ATP-dependent protease HslVU (ClpYQ) peptidase subunit
MTTIVAIQGDTYSVVGTDSRVSSFDEQGMAFQITTLGTGTAKIAQNGKYLLGAAGDVRAINILHHVFVPPTPTFSEGGAKLDHFITQKFIPSLRNCFENHGYAMPDNDTKNHMAEHNSTIVVVVNGVIYIIDGDYSWTSDRTGVYAIGSGSSYALGAIQAITGGKQLPIQKAKAAINKALSITSKFDPYTGSPFQIFVQEQND